MGALALRDLREIDGQPRVMDRLLGERLGFAQPVNIRKIIRSRLAEFERHGPIFSVAEKFPGQRRGPAGVSYHLNEAQALLACMFARTPSAADLREQVIKVFMAWRHGHLVSTSDAAEAPWAAMERRIAQLERLVSSQRMHVSKRTRRRIRRRRAA